MELTTCNQAHRIASEDLSALWRKIVFLQVFHESTSDDIDILMMHTIIYKCDVNAVSTVESTVGYIEAWRHGSDAI